MTFWKRIYFKGLHYKVSVKIAKETKLHNSHIQWCEYC